VNYKEVNEESGNHVKILIEIQVITLQKQPSLEWGLRKKMPSLKFSP
jgi:hypothetical protein